MKVIIPNYYKEFQCIAEHCKHTCCQGWEVEIDEESLARFEQHPDIMEKVEKGEDVHFRLLEGEMCPFLQEDGLCHMYLRYGEDMLCQTCADHPRFRNFWSDRIEMGLGMVCEEAARIILSREKPMELEMLLEKESEAQEPSENMDEDEEWLLAVRDGLLATIKEQGPLARFHEYLIYRHIADALYDDRLEERIRFIEQSVEKIRLQWEKSDGSIEALVEIVRVFSYDVEYDEEEKERILSEI